MIVVDNEDGTYTLEYLFFGKYTSTLDFKNLETSVSTKTSLSIKHNKVHIFGSPFPIEVFSVNTRLLEMEGVRKLYEDIFDIEKEIEKIENSSKNLESDSLNHCKSCSSTVVNSLVFPCSHFVYCSVCSEKLFKNSSDCFCGQKIVGYTKVLLN